MQWKMESQLFQKTIKSEEAGEKKFSFNNPLVSIGVGAVIFIIGEILEHVGNVPTIPMFALFLIAYLVLGGKVLITAGKNIMKGQVFDENFLMCIATIGAFCIPRSSRRNAFLSYR